MSEQGTDKPIEREAEKEHDEVSAKTDRANRKARKIPQKIVILLCCFAVVAGATYVVMFQVGKARLHGDTGMLTTIADGSEDEYDSKDGRIIKYKGSTYHLNDNMVTVLGMGIDKKGVLGDFGVIGENGQADALALAAIDIKTGKIVLVGISRDTMVDVDVYSKNGSFIRTDNKQICLAFAYGDGKKSSCENVAKSVSRLFYGLPINNFAAMNLEPVGMLNDAVGGVTVTSPDEVPLPGRTVKKNETVTLRGEEARRYVQYRDTSLLDSNVMRNVRQQQYMQAFANSAFRMTKDDITTPLKLFNKVSKYVVTNLDATKITYLTTNLMGANQAAEIDFRMVQGQVVQGEKYAEFITDETALYELILDVFYIKVS